MSPNRRTFLAATALSAFSQSRILGANDRIRIGVIGTGGRSRELLHALEASGGNEVVSVCDVYEPRRKAALNRAVSGSQDYADYHQLLDRKDIDAVVVPCAATRPPPRPHT